MNPHDFHSDPLDLLHALVLDTGKRWGEVAAEFQREDARAIFSPERPNLHFLTRGRGGSKTSDLAGIALAWLATEAPARGRGYVIASNADQAALLIDAAAGFIARTPELDGYLTPENERIVAPNGASVRVLPASDSGSWGLLNVHLIVADELCQWPETRGARRVYSAIRSTVQKTPGLRFVVLTTAGEPSHWSYAEVYRKAVADPVSWRVHEVPGPVPWQDPADIEALRRELLPSEFDRLVLNIWSEAEDRAIAPEDYDLAARPAVRYGAAPAGLKGGGWRLHAPRPGAKYVLTVDVGLSNDATVMCVAHRELLGEDRNGPQRVVVDHLERWVGSRRRHVQLEDVEDRVAELAGEYAAAVHADPDQFQGSLQRLNRRGVRAQAWPFTTASVGQVALGLVGAFRNGQIEVPDTPELRTELLRVRLRSSAPGITRLDHDRGGHDDMAVCIGLASHLLLGKRGFASVGDFIATVTEGSRLRDERAGGMNREEQAQRRELERHLRRMERGRGLPDRRRAQVQRACDHRWRLYPDGITRCVMADCGVEKQ